jgi:CRP/FNR family transcriptional regulator, cyclic AMP receptor protein
VISRLARRFKDPTTEEDVVQSKVSLLRESDLFRDFSPSDMEEVERVTTMTTCRRGRIFYSAGQDAEVLFVLKKGRVQLYRHSEDGKRLVTAIVSAGSIFGEMPLLSQRMHDNVAEALEDCTLCVMSRADVEHLLETKPRLALNVISILADRLAAAEQRMEMQAYGSVSQRLARLLLKLAAESDQVDGVSHQQLGDLIGASRETVTRVLGDLRARGAIEIGRSQVRILDGAGLREMAGPENG